MEIDEERIGQAAHILGITFDDLSQALKAAKAPVTDQPDESLRHLCGVLAMLANLHPDDQCTAYEEALAYYNAKCPNWQVAPVENFITRLVNMLEVERPSEREYSNRQGLLDSWQPIETAPKDGTAILAVCKGDEEDFVMAIWWQENVWFTGWVSGGHRSDYEDRHAMHWMPLPEIPRRGPLKKSESAQDKHSLTGICFGCGGPMWSDKNHFCQQVTVSGIEGEARK